jgi:hypothetical protein
MKGVNQVIPSKNVACGNVVVNDVLKTYWNVFDWSFARCRYHR